MKHCEKANRSQPVIMFFYSATKKQAENDIENSLQRPRTDKDNILRTCNTAAFKQAVKQ